MVKLDDLVLETRRQLSELTKDVNEKHEENLLRFSHLESSIEAVKVRLTIWGALAAGIPSAIVLGFEIWRAVMK